MGKIGRPKIYYTCNLCRRKMGAIEMRNHEPECRRKRLLKVGKTYPVKIANYIAYVKIEKINDDGSILARNPETGKEIKLKSYRRFRNWMDNANFRFHRLPETPPDAKAEKWTQKNEHDYEKQDRQITDLISAINRLVELRTKPRRGKKAV